jgi:hypothetical protein
VPRGRNNGLPWAKRNEETAAKQAAKGEKTGSEMKSGWNQGFFRSL